jgi:lipid II isoglutaminyl synthase (glutamine-hydrolysing)
MLDLGGENLLVVLNDRIPDGRDISWIWDVDLPSINKFGRILVSGDRAYDMALRLKYELGVASYESRVRVFSDLKKAIDTGVSLIKENETLFVLPTYSAMLETRKIITGKKIL